MRAADGPHAAQLCREVMTSSYLSLRLFTAQAGDCPTTSPSSRCAHKHEAESKATIELNMRRPRFLKNACVCQRILSLRLVNPP